MSNFKHASNGMISFCKNGRSAQVLACPLEKFNEIVDSPQVAQTCRLLAKVDHDSDEAKRLKQQLPLLMFMANYSDGHRHAESAVPTGMAYLDLDELNGEHPREAWQRIVQVLLMKELENLVVLVHVSCSGKGLRIVYIIPSQFSHLSPTEQIDQSKQWLAAQLGVEDDSKTKDLARGSFAVPRDYIIYGPDKRMFEKRTQQQLRTPSPLPLKGEGGHPQPEELSTPLPHREGPEASLLFKGVAYKDIIAEWFRRTGGEPQKGERNDRLHRLAAHLRYITDNNEQTLLSIMPRYGLSEEEMRGLIHSACSARFYSMPRQLQEIIGSLAPKEETARQTGHGSTPPPMPKRLPALIKLLTSKTPDIYKPAVAHAVFPSLAAHLWKVRFRYIDNVEHEATLMNVLMAGTGAGKDCISQPINRIMADIRLRDAENLKREAEWKREVNSKGSNKDKRQRPEGLVIQEVDPDMTNPAFVMRMAEADEHFLYTKMNEIDQFDALRGSARGSQQFQIMCLAFDPDNRYGQTRVGTQSVTEKVCIRFNWNAATTIQKGQRYFSRVLTDGPISRINFCTIPEREIGADMPIYGTYDAQFDEELRPYIERLTRASGVVDCPQAFRLAKKLKDECAEFSRLSQSRVYENLSFRANVIAWLKGCVLYICNDYRWSKEIEDFVRWSLKYDLWCKMQFFGAAIEAANQEAEHTQKRGPRNLLELLPDEFNVHDADIVRQANGMDTRGTRNMLSQWVHRGYLLQMTDDSFVKVKK